MSCMLEMTMIYREIDEKCWKCILNCPFTIIINSYLLHRYLHLLHFLCVSVTVTSEKKLYWTNVVSWRKHWIPLEVLLTWSKNDSNELFLCENNGSWTVVDRLNECKRCYFCHEMTMMAEMAKKYNVVWC